MSDISVDDMVKLLQESNHLITGNNGADAHAAPTIVSLHHFIHEHEEIPEAVIGDPDETLLPAGGLVIVGGEGGSSKTTLTLDAVAHICSGTDWLGFTTTRPVRALIIENEGPRPQFRQKLRAKAEGWTGADFVNNVYVWAEPWAQFSFASPTDRQHLIDFTEDRAVDLVVADPLDSLGIVGGGTPDDVRKFIAHLHDCGLHNPLKPLAFWLLHHFNKGLGRSVVQQLSGAWGGHPDAILGVELGEGQTTKLTWAKLRHATPPKDKTIVLAWDTETRGFVPLEKAVPLGPDELREKIIEYVTEHPGEAQSRIEEGVGGRAKSVREALKQLTSDPENPLLVLGPGRASNGKYYYPSNHAGLSTSQTADDHPDDQQLPLPGPESARPPVPSLEGKERDEDDRDASELPTDEPEFDDVPKALLAAVADDIDFGQPDDDDEFGEEPPG